MSPCCGHTCGACLRLTARVHRRVQLQQSAVDKERKRLQELEIALRSREQAVDAEASALATSQAVRVFAEVRAIMQRRLRDVEAREAAVARSERALQVRAEALHPTPQRLALTPCACAEQRDGAGGGVGRDDPRAAHARAVRQRAAEARAVAEAAARA